MNLRYACHALLPCWAFLSSHALAETPQSLTIGLKAKLAETRPSCVAISVGGSASGVIISPDGLVLTAAHILRKFDADQPAKITLHDGRVAEAELLGFNRETDFALLRITSPSEEPWPHCQLADVAPTTGAFCFTIAHPSGLLKGRPPLVRLGRITSHSENRGKPFMLIADCNIQPGDSGGPLFSMDGELIGIDSSAANILGFNIFPAIDQYHLDKDRLLKGDRWGDVEKAPDGPEHREARFDKESLAAIQKEFLRRVKIEYPPTVDYVRGLANKDGEVKLDQQAMVDHMTRDALAIAKKQAISLGLDDPDLAESLTPLHPKLGRPIPIYSKDKVLCFGTAIDPGHVLTKLSRIEGAAALTIRTGEGQSAATRAASDETWDLAILEIGGDKRLEPISWPPAFEDIAAGDLIVAPDRFGRIRWNVASDSKREVKGKRSIGPLRDKSIISKHRAPYPLVIRHALPLGASDAGTPIFDAEGQFLGMHIARYSRTIGLFIPAEELRDRVESMLDPAPEPSQEKTPTEPAHAEM